MGIPERKVVPIEAGREEDIAETKQLPQQLTKQLTVEVNSQFGKHTTGKLNRQQDAVQGLGDNIASVPVLRSNNHKNLLSYLSSQQIWYTKNQEISDGSGLPYETVRGGLRKLESIGCIKKSMNSNNGLKLEVLIPAGELGISTEQANRTGSSDKIDRLYNKSFYLTQKDTDRLWPKTSARGFHVAHYRELIQDFESKGFEPSNIKQALNYIEFQLSQNALVDQHGNPVGDVPAWLLKSLRSNGYYSRPRNYVSPEEQVHRDLFEEQERIKETRLKVQELRASNWWEELPSDHPAKLDRMMGNKESWIIHQYKKYEVKNDQSK